MDYRELVNLGLAEKEAKVYLAALELGKSPVQAISKRAKVNRATTYVILETLMKKGLVSSLTEGKKQLFFAETPEKLSLIFREQEIQIKERQETLKKLLPELKSIKAPENENPAVRYFEGKEGLIAMTEEFYLTTQNETAKMIYPLDLIKEIFTKEERENFTKRRIKKGVNTEVIYTAEEGERKSSPDGKRIKVDEQKFPITSEIAIFSNKVRLSSLKGKLQGMIIEDNEIAKTLKSLFKLALIGAKYLHKKEKRLEK